MPTFEDELEATLTTLLVAAEALAGQAVAAGSALSEQSAQTLLRSAETILDAAVKAAEAAPAVGDVKSLGVLDDEGAEGQDGPALRALAAGKSLPRLAQQAAQVQRRSALVRARLSMASAGRALLDDEESTT